MPIQKARFIPDVGGQGQRKSGQLCLVLVRPDRQTTDRVFLKIRTKSGHRTESRQTESGQTDTGQKIRTESGQQTDTGQDFPENPDKNETRTGHGQCCPPTSGNKNIESVVFENEVGT